MNTRPPNHNRQLDEIGDIFSQLADILAEAAQEAREALPFVSPTEAADTTRLDSTTQNGINDDR